MLSKICGLMLRPFRAISADQSTSYQPTIVIDLGLEAVALAEVCSPPSTNVTSSGICFQIVNCLTNIVKQKTNSFPKAV